MNRFHRYSAAGIFAAVLILPAVLRADCPEGTRDTTEAERRDYLNTLNAIKSAVPPAPAGWQLQLSRFGSPTQAPTFTCKGSKLTIQPTEVTYVSLEQQKLNEQVRLERNARMAALRKLPPDQQKQADDFTQEGMRLSGQSAKARKTDPAEAARLLKLAKECYAKSGAIHRAHSDKTEPQVRAIEFDNSKYLNPDVRVHVAVDDLPVTPPSGAERLQIPGVSRAYINSQNWLVMSFGQDAAGRNIRVWLEGERDRAMTIARLLAESGLRKLAAR